MAIKKNNERQKQFGQSNKKIVNYLVRDVVIWARDDNEVITTFSTNLYTVFQPLPTSDPDSDEIVYQFLNIPPNVFPIHNMKPREVEAVIIKGINPKKAPGFDLITGKFSKE